MAIDDITPRKIHTYTGVGEYEASFKVYDPTTVVVTAEYADGSTSQLVYLTDYTLDIPESDPGVTVDVTSTDYDEAVLLRIERVLPFTQTTDWYNGSNLDMPLLTRSFDQVVMLLQQMNVEVTAGTSAFEWEGVWATATSYQVRSLVEGPDGNWYYCNEAHTSETFSTDLSSGYWVLLINRASLLEAVADAEAAEVGAETAQAAAEEAMSIAQDAALNIVEAWADDPTSYDFPDLVAGTDGHTYRCLGTAVVGENPVIDDGTHWFRLTGSSAPVGSVVAFVGGYFTNGSNAGFTSVLGNTAAAVNALLNDIGWYVCDGAALNLSASSIFNGASRYLPNLTDDRFIMGDTAAGVVGGDNTMAHNHTMAHTHSVDIASFTSGATTLTTAQIPSHTHVHAQRWTGSSGGVVSGSAQDFNNSNVTGGGSQYVTTSTGGSGSHTHAVNPPATTSSAASTSTTSAASNTENRPAFLSAIYIMKVA